MKQITESLYAIVVPEEATHLTRMDNELWWYIDGAGSHYKEDVGFDFTTLGEVSQDTITFDVTKITYPYDSVGRFRSLLTSKGINIEENTKLAIVKKI